MNRAVRNLQNLKGARVAVTQNPPTQNSLPEGGEQYVVINGTLYLYKKVNGVLYRFSGTAV